MEYEIKDIKKGNVWSSGYGDMQSYTISLSGVSEPVVLNKKVPVKQDPQIGDKLYGKLEEKRNQKGNTYMKFTAEKPPEDRPTSSWHESPEKQQSINRAVALNNAVLYAPIEKLSADRTLEIADLFYSWLVQEKPKDEVGEEPIRLEDIPF